MSGILDLATLLTTLDPVLVEGEFVYVSVPPNRPEDYLHLKPLGLFFEAEGLTLILPVETAVAADLETSSPLRCITMNVHSSLEAVGLTAAIATALTKEGISANVVAAYYHDHVLVPAGDAIRAVEVLKSLSTGTAI